MMLPDAADSNPQARRETTCHCATMPPLGRHWFVSHDGHFCEACNLPAGNWRHVPRVSAL